MQLQGISLALLLSLLLWLQPQHCRAEAGPAVFDITDENFDNFTSTGTWMIKVYAPWCTHCRQLEPLWQVFADEAQAEGVKVGRIDGTKEKTLMTRFKVNAFPSIYLLKDGRTWVYSGPRNVESFKRFATKTYETQTPLPFYKAPNSFVGRIIGRVHSVPALMKKAYRILRHERGFSDTTIVLGFLSIPVFTGAVLICALDAVYIRRARLDMLHEHDE